MSSRPSSRSFSELCADLPTESDFMVPADFVAATQDHEDHSFSGIMFNIHAKPAQQLPIKFIELHSVSLRGELGEISVYYTPDGFKDKETSPDQWTCVCKEFHRSSWSSLKTIQFHSPIRMAPSSSIGLYIHSTLEGDEAIVYGEKYANVTHEDAILQLMPGMAHIDNRPFSSEHAWGYPWRVPRQFVGRISYGVKYLLWSPSINNRFPSSFKRCLFTILACHRYGTLSRLPRDVLFYMLNMCGWDWFGGLEDTEMDIDEEELKEREVSDPRYFGMGWEDFVAALAQGTIRIVELPQEEEEE